MARKGTIKASSESSSYIIALAKFFSLLYHYGIIMQVDVYITNREASKASLPIHTSR